MRGVILAAGEGSRMGEHTDDRPKAFIDIDGRTLYERQRVALAPHVETVTVVLGYRADAVREAVAPTDRVIVFEEWREYENSESLRRALADVRGDDDVEDETDAEDEYDAEGDDGPDDDDASDAASTDDVLVLNGDVIVGTGVVGRLVRRHRAFDGASVVGCLPGRQEEHTAVRCDDAGRITDYGMIEGYRHAGLGIIDRGHVARAERTLREHTTEWYPVVYPELDTRRVFVPPARHVEINRPAHLRAARDRLPFGEDDSAPIVGIGD